MFNLLINWFHCEDKDRGDEYYISLFKNLENPHISKVFLFSTSKTEPKHDKIEVIKFSEDPTVKDMVEYADENLRGKKCIIANTDIVFDDTLCLMEDLSNKFVALTRWEEGSLYRPAHGSDKSQDSWVFISPVGFSDKLDFTLGRLGADNIIAYEANKAGFQVTNPSRYIKTHHMHRTKYRKRARQDRLEGNYLFVSPSEFFSVPNYYHGTEDGQPARIKSNK
jgi:hypothetical protein